MDGLVLVLVLVAPLLFLAGIYWAVRIGVRDGMHDAARDSGTPIASITAETSEIR